MGPSVLLAMFVVYGPLPAGAHEVDAVGMLPTEVACAPPELLEPLEKLEAPETLEKLEAPETLEKLLGVGVEKPLGVAPEGLLDVSLMKSLKSKCCWLGSAGGGAKSLLWNPNLLCRFCMCWRQA
jgi:hypothetical protein